MSVGRTELVDLLLARLDATSPTASVQWSEGSANTPTRYAIIENLLPEEIAVDISQSFPQDGDGFLRRSSFRERKCTSYNFDRHPKLLEDATFAIQDTKVVDKIASIIGVDGLEPDPHLYAGGLSMMFNGDFLNPHIDNSHERTKSKYRRLNLLYYVTPDWREEFGGNLELWDPDVTRPVTLTSRFNRLVLMETNKGSWHSVSPVQVDKPRCCLSNYYFSEQSPTGDTYYHVTSFTGRPDQPVRRIVGSVDNAARKFARERLGLKRRTDAGYEQEHAETR